jgi:beta-barrel assembly-enhancing protease
MKKSHTISKPRYLMFIGIFSLLFCPNIWAQVALPELSTPSHTTLSPTQEKRLGRAFMQAVRTHTNLLEDAASLSYLNKLGQQLSQHAWPTQDFTFFIVNDPSINAFAGPGGYVGMNTGLITTTSNEAELAAVLAHEITHVTQRHIARGIEKSSQGTWPTVGAIVAAVLMGGQMDTAVTAGAILGAAAGKMQHTINFTRRFEHEADRIGMRVLFDTGLNPLAMPAFFDRMQNRSLDYSDSRLKLLRTHPVTEDRIADSQNRAQFYAKRPTQLNQDYALIKTRIQVLTAPTSQDILNAYHTQYQDNPTNELAQYGYALALVRNQQNAHAEKIYQQLIQNNPQFPLYTLSLAQAQWSTNPETASDTLAQGCQKFPNYNPLVLLYSQYLIDHEQPDKARKLLEQHLQQNKNNPQFYALLSQAQGRSQHLVAAYQSRAQLFLLNNQLRRAITQLHQALKLAKHNPSVKRSLQKRIIAIKQEIMSMEE